MSTTKLQRTYIDRNGVRRTIIRVRQHNNFIKWSKTKPECFTSLWRLEDGWLVQIPENAWEDVKIIEDESITNTPIKA